MNSLSIFTLKVFHKLYRKTFGDSQLSLLQREENPDKISDIIYNYLIDEKPCMIARLGAFELNIIINYIGVQQGRQSFLKYIKGEALKWWWDEQLIKFMNTNAGFFPPTQEKIKQFCELMLKDAKEVDLLGSWQSNESYIYPNNNLIKVQLLFLEPFWSNNPWSRALQGKKVLVIHPFAETIKSQYQKRELLFKNQSILPTFKELFIIQAVQSLGGSNQFNDWFEALDYMKKEMDKIDYEICLIGCGAYGFPLAAYAKRQGKKAIHLGGALQLLFGIKGKRWEYPNFGEITFNRKGAYLELMNEYWCYPNESETPKSSQQVEGGCYW